MDVSFTRGNGRRLKLGVVANEFFDLSYSRMGGFGWATQQVSHCFGADPALGVDVVLIDAQRGRDEAGARDSLHGVRVIARPNDAASLIRQLKAERFDVLLSIDYRKNYRAVFDAMPRVPIVVWARDPRTPDDMRRIVSVRLPGKDAVPTGLDSPDTTSLSQIVPRWWWSRPIVFGTPSLSLREKAMAAYALPEIELALLPNIVDIDAGGIEKSERPTVVFLGRLDNIKRPWLFAELASHFPAVEFLMLGQSHHSESEISWRPLSLPSNVRQLGHVDGAERLRALAAAWALVNTSVHEGLAVSFLEALKCRTPLLACVDTEQVVSRYGVFAGRYDGSGLDAIPALVAGLRRLLADHDHRQRLGTDGQAWVAGVHNRERFLESFHRLCVKSRVLR